MGMLRKKPLIIGHRGASAHAPENTIAAFQLALKFGADAVELDAKLSADGAIVVIHDQTVDRTTNGQGKISEFSLTEIKKLDAGSKFDLQFEGEAIPTLEEVFEVVGGKLLINVELTNYAMPNDDLPERVAELVKRMKMEMVLFFQFSSEDD